MHFKSKEWVALGPETVTTHFISAFIAKLASLTKILSFTLVSHAAPGGDHVHVNTV